MIGEKSDRELLEQAAAGDQAAFAMLVRRHQIRVLNLAYRFSRDRQDAEDLAQEVFLKVWRHARSFKGQAAFSTWLYRLAVNTCLNYRQRKKSRPKSLPLTADLESRAEAAAEGLEARQRQDLLGRAMAALPARQKMALILAGFEGKSYEEIAAVMEVSVPAVESLLFRARRNLAATLRPLKKKGDL
ncbi:MAG: sigma-70 family RNA polymerase sigma factor [Acidobacteria bacterium]|nr:sigma-70 family RNA polymerase sigma factor [Acidobacteriota bacterium]MBU4308072.1 sigma-70 family RNA polymerase sigma factor [Acidobacteriota bacterium]